MRFTRRPLASSRAAEASLLVLTAAFAVGAAGYTFPVGSTVRDVLNDGVYNNVVLAAGAACLARGLSNRRERPAWFAMGAAVLAWGIGNTVWTFTVQNDSDPPYP